MSGRIFPVRLAPERVRVGLIVLRADETIEREFRQLFPAGADLLVSRVASGRQLTLETLAAMEADLAAAAALFPEDTRLDALGYACTSGTARIGADRIAALLGPAAAHVTEPVSALVATARARGLRRLALLSPYEAAVSARLRAVLAEAGIETPVFGSFDVTDEATVARIAPDAITDAALALTNGADVDGLFLSCTNLATLDVLAPLEARLGMPVMSSNSVLAGHLRQLADLP
ncbi:Asp/Glu/Hydantoin racemase family protein [Oceanicola granulosus HTCC2516]|uniref:Asp/Glu/Hydantoin racemase family protein n=1 Tax=Oceanicola granulosus (strain ATCC BAA-861 / DSM 15982 / KCTC 12143 / HTCC2516) TaxID=314256 RepID=Q2CC27_OCEGH|nr:aspartate/glutamate racemase family protein [Oceanicola granulosus]EAR50254.1 Asp/Glu/Hydantoin racemase family protein [Oceanicola granulosus HTCC2516]